MSGAEAPHNKERAWVFRCWRQTIRTPDETRTSAITAIIRVNRKSHSVIQPAVLYRIQSVIRPCLSEATTFGWPLEYWKRNQKSRLPVVADGGSGGMGDVLILNGDIE
jgi:hypothetical protein